MSRNVIGDVIGGGDAATGAMMRCRLRGGGVVRDAMP
jgi:hypothetical protein